MTDVVRLGNWYSEALFVTDSVPVFILGVERHERWLGQVGQKRQLRTLLSGIFHPDSSTQC